MTWPSLGTEDTVLLIIVIERTNIIFTYSLTCFCLPQEILCSSEDKDYILITFSTSTKSSPKNLLTE